MPDEHPDTPDASPGDSRDRADDTSQTLRPASPGAGTGGTTSAIDPANPMSSPASDEVPRIEAEPVGSEHSVTAPTDRNVDDPAAPDDATPAATDQDPPVDEAIEPGEQEPPADVASGFELTAIDATSPDPVASDDADLPPIPGKRYFAIGEVAELCRVKPHVLRYWEQEFDQLNPAKRRGNRRYYQQQDVILIRQIRGLLNDRGFTISGAKQELSGDDAKQDQTQYRLLVKQMIAELEDLLRDLRTP